MSDFYAPTNRAGTANQDFGFAYSANKAMELLGTAEGTEYSVNDEKQYTDMIEYKYGEMADGQKWFSDLNALGLEGGASHGGWAGDMNNKSVPIRFVSENLGWKINWNAGKHIVEISE